MIRALLLAAGALAVWRHRPKPVDDAARMAFKRAELDRIADLQGRWFEPEDGVQGVDPWPASFVDFTYYPVR